MPVAAMGVQLRGLFAAIGVMQSEVRHEDGRLLATAIGSYSIFPPKPHLEDAAMRARSEG